MSFLHSTILKKVFLWFLCKNLKGLYVFVDEAGFVLIIDFLVCSLAFEARKKILLPSNKYRNFISWPLFVHIKKITVAFDTSFNFFSVFSDMMAFHKPKMYKSMNGCCICKAKSSRYNKTDIVFLLSIYVKFLFILQSRCIDEKMHFFLFSSRFTMSGKYSEDFKICFSLLEVKKQPNFLISYEQHIIFANIWPHLRIQWFDLHN